MKIIRDLSKKIYFKKNDNEFDTLKIEEIKK